jgi:hypothetical protein
MASKKAPSVAVTKGKSIGGSMGGAMEYTRGYKQRVAEKQKKEENYWASMNGPVLIRKESQCCIAQ